MFVNQVIFICGEGYEKGVETIIDLYDAIISELHANGKTSFIYWVFFNMTNGILAIVFLSLFWIGEEVGCRRIKDNS